MTLSISKFSQATGFDRRPITARVIASGLKPARVNKRGVKLYHRTELEAVTRDLVARAEDVERSKTLKALNLDLKNAKLAAETAILRRGWTPKSEFAHVIEALKAGIRRIVSQVHLCAPQLIGLSAVEAEKILKAKEDEVLTQLQALPEQIERESQ